MKLRFGLIIFILGVSVQFHAAVAQESTAPTASTAPSRSPQARTNAPSSPQLRTNPSSPSQQTAPSVPAVSPVPAVPNAPTVPPVPAVPDVDPLGDVMFPPDLILRHARELGLTDDQKAFIRSEVQKTTTRFNELQWQLQDAMEVLHESLESSTVSDQHALSLLDKVLDIEREIKHLHVGLGIHLKNRLTPEQQTKLQAMRRTPRAPHQQGTPE